jgi:hypothetical protein
VTLDNDWNWVVWEVWVLSNDVSLCVVEPFEGFLVAVLAIFASWVRTGKSPVASLCSMLTQVAFQVP